MGMSSYPVPCPVAVMAKALSSLVDASVLILGPREGSCPAPQAVSSCLNCQPVLPLLLSKIRFNAF